MLILEVAYFRYINYKGTSKILYNICSIDNMWGIILNEKPRFKQLNFKLSEKQLDQLENLSTAMGNVSKSNLIRIAITEYLMKYKDLLEESKE